MPLFIDVPGPAATCALPQFRVEGWAFVEPGEPPLTRVEVWARDVCIGSTESLFHRDDVTHVHHLPVSLRTGFAIRAETPDRTDVPLLSLHVRAMAGDASVMEVSRPIHLPRPASSVAPRANPPGAAPADESGPAPVPDRLEPVVIWSARLVGPPPARILEIGCERGELGRRLLSRQYAWHGVESSEEACADLARHGLPHTRGADPAALPFRTGSFDLVVVRQPLASEEAWRALAAWSPHALLATDNEAEAAQWLEWTRTNGGRAERLADVPNGPTVPVSGSGPFLVSCVFGS